MTVETPPRARSADRLRAAGLRVTASRLTVLAVLEGHPGHHTVDTVVRLSRERHGRPSTQATYDILAALTEAGLARRIQPAGGPARFELRVGDNHHHLVCRSCGVVADVDCVVGSAPCMDATDAGGFVIEEADVTFWGLCLECRSKT